MVDPKRDPMTAAHQPKVMVGLRAGRFLSTGLAISMMAGLLFVGEAAMAGQPSDGVHSDPVEDMALIAALDGQPAPAPRAQEATAPAATPAATEAPTEKAPEVVQGAVQGASAGVSGAEADDVTVTHGFTAGSQAAMVSPAPLPSQDTGTAGTGTPSVTEIPAKVTPGDTLIGLLIDAGVDRMEAHRAIKALKDVYDPRGLRPGHVINVRFTTDTPDEEARFDGFSLKPSVDTEVVVDADPSTDTGYRAQENKANLKREVVRFSGPITYSLYQAAVDAGVSEAALADMIRVLSYDIDFQRDIKKDDTFEILYERFDTPDGKPVRTGKLLFTALTNGGKRLTAYAFEQDDGFTEYFDEQGHGVRKPLMRTPVDGARISSPFGMRRHPILGYSKMHTGVDFAAPTGTPIYAAGDGVVQRAGRNGGYGNYIRIRHNAEFSTAYGHMSRILVKPGQRVHQGDVIGRVGTTGRSTGPHLHYEIIQNGHKVNPMGVRFKPAVELAGADLQRFLKHKADIDQLYDGLRTTTEVASTTQPPANTIH